MATVVPITNCGAWEKGCFTVADVFLAALEEVTRGLDLEITPTDTNTGRRRFSFYSSRVR